MSERTFKPSEVHKLEDPARLTWLPPAEVLSRLALQPGMVVADIGAGTGYFAIPIARAVFIATHSAGQEYEGKVFAVDSQEEMLHKLREKLSQPGMPGNIELIHGSAADTHLQDRSCGLVLMANVWHELDDHRSALTEAGRILQRDGRLAILDWRPDVSRPPGPPLDHRIAPGEVVERLSAQGWSCRESSNVGTFSYLVIAAPPSR
ncbi:MAG: class I SAM-dependent methyltransferase [Terriglobales bacterium]